MREPVEREVVLPFRPDLVAMLRAMQRGSSDPTLRFSAEGLWRTAVTPAGPATQRLTVAATNEASTVLSSTWGPGAQWLAERAPDLVGAADDPTPFEELCAASDSPVVAAVARLWREHGRRWRVPRGHNVWESAVAAVLEQKVTGLEAKRAWSGITRLHGTPAPGPAPDGMLVLPSTDAVRRIPSWTWRRLGVDRPRSDTIMRLARLPHVLERLPAQSHEEARRQLTSIPGVGVWTHAEVAQRALGDPDALSVGDFHLAGHIVHALTGRMDGDDDEMLRLLAPLTGQRFRAAWLLEVAGPAKPRRGPRMPVPAHRYG